MASFDFILPATTYRPPSPTQARGRRRSLNTIIEEAEESIRDSIASMQSTQWKLNVSNLSNVPNVPSVPDDSPDRPNWLSPLSDHFPTPRGVHFMRAPTLDSPSSASESASPSSSAPWTRNSYSTNTTDFDDLYDVSDDERNRRKSAAAERTRIRRQSAASSRRSSGASHTSLPALVIPNNGNTGGGDRWPGVAAFKMMSSPIPPTPPPKIPMSPAVFTYLASMEVPSCSNPPSLDGSMTSEQMAAMSAPATPEVGNDEVDVRRSGHWDDDGGVQLQPEALATLQAIAGHDTYDHHTEQIIEVPPQSPMREMQQSPPRLNTNIHRNDSIVLSPDTQRSLNDLTRLEIPSPGGVFSALPTNARHTWHLVSASPYEPNPPSSTTAEHFYKTPWSSAPVERIVEVSETMSDGIPTARPQAKQFDSDSTIRPTVRPDIQHIDSDETITAIPAATSPVEDIVATEILTGYDENYGKKISNTAAVNLDRTNMWLSAQTDYLAALINPPEARDDEVALKRRSTIHQTKKVAAILSPSTTDIPPMPTIPKKSVRFSEIVQQRPISFAVPLPAIRQESAYYRAFQHLLAASRPRDVFVHRTPRFEALQASRISFTLSHRNQLLGRYQLSALPCSPKRRMSANVARGDEFTPDDPAKFKREKEFEAKLQMRAAVWNVQAIKLLNGGRLLCAPVAKRLARLSSMGPTTSGAPRDRARFLDLGGNATCDWAWYCAAEYPNTKVYTVTTHSIRQLSNSNIRGPKNHRSVYVEKLVKLPFRDAQFDLINARYVYSILRASGENGEDEWAGCLKECMRVLKPGGYIEFSLLDSDLVNAGPLGQAKSVEFGLMLKTLGYDPCPTKSWIGRLRAAGFENVKRAWVVLPMGTKTQGWGDVCRDSRGVERKVVLEAMVQGSTGEVAPVTGLVGGWAWERWMVKGAMEMRGKRGCEGADSGGLWEGVSEVVEEGRKCGAGWRTLNGWARKPLV